MTLVKDKQQEAETVLHKEGSTREPRRFFGAFARLRSRYRFDAACIAIMIAFFFVFFWRIFLRHQLPLIGDPLYYSYPMREVAWDMIRNGTFPLWTPYIFSGYPLLSMAQLGLGYPVTWAYLVLPGHWAETLYVIVPFLLAPIFIYAYVRTLGLSRIAALLAGLSFTYGGMMASRLSNGMLPNAVMWLPLLLLAIERSRRGRFLLCLTGATVAYAMTVLTGIGQGIVMTGIIGGSYALVTTAIDLHSSPRRAWRPIAVTIGAFILAAGVAAFQILETLTALRLSVRRELTYELFGQLSFPIWRAWSALWIPLYYHIESAPYLAPVTLGLAVVGAVTAIKSPRANHQALFWIAVAAVSAVLIAGTHTPIYRLMYEIPILNKFRGGSRHSFGWTLGISVLGAYGWDRLSLLRTRMPEISRRRLLRTGLIASALLSAVVTIFWWRDIADRMPIESQSNLTAAAMSYIGFKGAFVVLSGVALFSIWRMGYSRSRSLMLGCCLAWMCFVEASFFMRFAWANPAVPSRWFAQVRRPTRFLKEYSHSLGRVYLRIVGFDPRDIESRNLDFLNLSARHKLENIAGYEPLILERYSRALGDAWLDGVRTGAGAAADFSLFDPRSKVLDVLNTSLVAGYSNLEVSLPHTIEKEGLRFAARDFPKRRNLSLGALSAEGNTLAIVSQMSHSVGVANGTPVAKISVRTRDGRVIERFMVAGRDTAEWAHERPDVRSVILHDLAPIFERFNADKRGGFPTFRYWCRIPLGERVVLDRVDISPVLPGVDVEISKASLVSERTNQGTPLVAIENETGPSEFRWLRDETRWEKVYDREEVLILRNRRLLPRVWLTGSAEVHGPEEVLQRIQGRSAIGFNERTTVLLERAPPEIKSLPGTELSPECRARVVRYEANRVSIETACQQPSMLVASEINYPGWEATLDGKQVSIYTANYLLRAVPLGEGSHVVEMRYRAPGARLGAIISACTLLVLCGLVIVSRPVRRAREVR